jgi:hypothetical protein
VYSIKKSYPDYAVMLFINGKLLAGISSIVDKIHEYYDDIDIIEDVFNDCKKMNAVTAQSLRWVLWDEKFKTFDYIYFIDADIFYIREPVPLHEQHIRHMQYIKDAGISNIVRKLVLPKNILSKKTLAKIYINYYCGGIKAIIQYFYGKDVYRMSGIHFIKTDEYYKKITHDLLRKHKQYIYNGKIASITKFANDEALLYMMIKESGWDMSHFAIQRTSTSMFDFNQPEKKEFCPHHGIHLGIFRSEIDKIQAFAIAQLNTEDYRYYVQKFEEEILTDPFFHELYEQQPDYIKLTFSRFYQYYNIKKHRNNECEENYK